MAYEFRQHFIRFVWKRIGLLAFCVGTGRSCPIMSAPRCRLSGSSNKHHVLALSNTSRVPICRGILTASHAASSS